jgi:hypothetical protein
MIASLLVGRSTNERINAMKNHMTIGLERTEENLLIYAVSDEALETAGGNEIAGNYTLASCTGLSVCPG